MKIVGFQSGHDVAYCILENGVPIIHEELERISRKKMQIGDGLKFFFSRFNENTDNIKYFTFGNRNSRIGKWQKICAEKESDDKMNKILSDNNGSLFEFSHHLCHAANAFYTSNFDRSLIFTLDGGGFEDDDSVTALTISEGIGNKINRIKTFPISEIDFGGLWNDATRHIFGLSVGPPKGSQEGTVMAMAALGEAKYLDLFTRYRRSKLSSIANLSEQEKFNVAASLQQYTEQTFYNYISKYVNESDHKNLCFSGGVSLNSVMLGKIKQWFPQIKNVFCDPVPYDAGLSLGSARYLWHHVLNNPRVNNIKNMSPYLGKIYTKKNIKNASKLYQDQIKLYDTTDKFVLNKINDQKIVAVFGGGSESGRRALGNRSILADPRNVDMKALINEKIKHREWFRPFAPSILEEKIDEWFENPSLSPYMSFALKFKKNKKNKVPAVVHYDGTGRLQTVNKKLSPWYYKFIKKWEKLSGVPILLNTSFNDSEPIVETPEDALKCFLAAQIDYLYFFDYGILVEKLKFKTNHVDLKKDLQTVEMKGSRTRGFDREWKPLLEKYKFNIFCEIGVLEGKNFKNMIKSIPNKAVAIDPWIEDRIRSRNDLGQKQIQLDTIYENFKREMTDMPFVKIIRGYSFNVVREFPDEYFDLIYIDADHTYEACLQDIRDWYPKVKRGGVISGDDYVNRTFRGIKFGVIEATRIFCKENNLEVIEFPRLGWAIIKP